MEDKVMDLLYLIVGLIILAQGGSTTAVVMEELLQ
jgi:hypothetical protein